MSNSKCEVCAEDPGLASFCQHCGARRYRYATEEPSLGASATAELGAELGIDFQNRTAPDSSSTRVPQPPALTEGHGEVFSHSQQMLEAARIEHEEFSSEVFGLGNQSSQPAQKPGAQVLVRMVLVGVLLMAGISLLVPKWLAEQRANLPTQNTLSIVDASSPTEQPQLLSSWSHLELGDCVLWPAAEGGFPTVVDCRTDHDAEITLTGDLPGDDWPFSSEDFNLQPQCLDGFAAYIGTNFETSQWRTAWTAPNEAEWEQGDHEFQCYVFIRGEQNREPAYRSKS